jgi:hypothetical protein
MRLKAPLLDQSLQHFYVDASCIANRKIIIFSGLLRLLFAHLLDYNVIFDLYFKYLWSLVCLQEILGLKKDFFDSLIAILAVKLNQKVQQLTANALDLKRLD